MNHPCYIGPKNHISTCSLYTKESHHLLKFVISLATKLLSNLKTDKNGLTDFNQLINTNNIMNIELAYYSTSFLCKAIANRSDFNAASTNSSDAYV